jgi:hypothetical protein
MPFPFAFLSVLFMLDQSKEVFNARAIQQGREWKKCAVCMIPIAKVGPIHIDQWSYKFQDLFCTKVRRSSERHKQITRICFQAAFQAFGSSPIKRILKPFLS